MIIVTCSVIIRRNNAILFVQETKEIAKGKYGLPGGKLEDGETLEACAIRETREETGLSVRIDDLIAVTQKPLTHEGNNVLRYIYTASIDNDSPKRAEMDVHWFTHSDILEYGEMGKIRGKDVQEITLDVLADAIDYIQKPKIFD